MTPPWTWCPAPEMREQWLCPDRLLCTAVALSIIALTEIRKAFLRQTVGPVRLRLGFLDWRSGSSELTH